MFNPPEETFGSVAPNCFFLSLLETFQKPTGLSFDLSPHLKESFCLHKGISSWLIDIAKLPSITYKYWGEVQVLRDKKPLVFYPHFFTSEPYFLCEMCKGCVFQKSCKWWHGWYYLSEISLFADHTLFSHFVQPKTKSRDLSELRILMTGSCQVSWNNYSFQICSIYSWW